MNTTDPSLSTIEDGPLFNGIDCQTELESRKMNPGFNSLLTIRHLGDMATEEDRQSNTLRSNTVVPSRTQQPEPAPDQYLGELVNNRYLVEKELGRGGLGVVYLARDKHLLSKPVVLKVLLEESIKNEWARTKFSQEIEALARIDHPGIVGVLDAGEMPDGKPYLAMQFVEGKSLRSIIKEGGIGPERVKNLVQQMAKALTAVHEKGIYH
ncbi:MAG TPA: protein kinase, partial [Acidobacteriota bacterium]|nr:protein kinase [Acidobacteriota bacterium]